jgi:hypothetical protein
LYKRTFDLLEQTVTHTHEEEDKIRERERERIGEIVFIE